MMGEEERCGKTTTGEEMSHTGETGIACKPVEHHKDSGRRRGLGMSHRESRVWPRTSWTPMDVGLE